MSRNDERLDIHLVKIGLMESREKAKKNIIAGNVFVNNRRVIKPALIVSVQDYIEIKDEVLPYVGRGGLKLEKALRLFDVNVKAKTYLDIGASTGGFTHCLLRNGAEKVYAIDVGCGQLSPLLLNDSRVINMEGTNIRKVTKGDFIDTPNGAVIDVSFISLKLVLPIVKELIKDNGDIVILIKPQFEAGRINVGKRGVIKSPLVHKEVLLNILSFSRGLNLFVKNLTYSPIKGPEGNIEFLAYLGKNSESQYISNLSSWIDIIVREAHDNL